MELLKFKLFLNDYDFNLIYKSLYALKIWLANSHIAELTMQA